MAHQQEAPNCFDIHVGRNLLLATLVLGTAVAMGAETANHLASHELSPGDTRLVSETSETATLQVEAGDQPEYSPDYADGTMIFVEGLGTLLLGTTVVVLRSRKNRR